MTSTPEEVPASGLAFGRGAQVSLAGRLARRLGLMGVWRDWRVGVGVAGGTAATVAEWLRFLLTNLGGGAVNYTAYAILVAYSATVHEFPVLGVAAGALSGMTVNFFASRWLVFNADRAR